MRDDDSAKMTDRDYLQTKQYGTAANLNARVSLHARFSTNKQGWQRWVFEQIRQVPGCSVLELGCGPGNLWRDNSEQLPDSWRVTLTDFSPGMVQQARQNLPAGRFAYAVADAQAIPFAAGSFDALIANHMLYHVPDRPRALAEVRRVLRPGGVLYAATVGGDHMRELDEMVMRFDPAIAETGIGLGKPYTPFSLENGGDQLAAWFQHVTVRRYDDALKVTEPGPLVDYICSGADALATEKLEELRRFVQRELDTKGVLHITKDSGLFVAW